MSDTNPLRQYLKDAGVGLSQGANDLGIDRTTLWRWLKNGVPADRCADVSAATGIPASKLRPDLAAQFGTESAA